FVANALWGQRGVRFLPEFLRLAEDQYRAKVAEVDFRGDPGSARRTINAWVSERTRRKIEMLLEPPDPAPSTVLVLTNAVYFRSAWSSPFPEAKTRPEDFRVEAERTVRVPMMHQVGTFGHCDGDGFQALELSYEGGDLAMVVVLPKQVGGLGDLERSLTPQRLADWMSRLEPRRVDVALPRFKVSSAFRLKDTLSAMGMPLAFTSKADFSGMAGAGGLSLSDVIHRAYVDVNEKGTEAAAATAVIVGRSAAPGGPVVTFRADHPFLFIVRDQRTGCILFLGRVKDPGA